jgi:integrase
MASSTPTYAPLPVSDPVAKLEQRMRLKGRAETSIDRFRDVAEEFVRAVGKKKAYSTEDVDRFNEYLLAKQKTRGWTDDTRMKGSYLRFVHYALKALFRANKWEWYDEDDEELPKLNRPLRRFYHIDDINKILDAAKASRNLRDYAAFRLINLAFSRRRSWVLLKRWDYDPEHGVIKMPIIKGGRQLVLELDKETNDALLKYLSKRVDQYQAMFPSYRPRHESGQMRPEYVNTLLKKYCAMAGVECKGVHAFRRGMVTYLYDQGYREKEIYEMGDWSSEDMVREYIQLSESYSSEGRREGHPFFAGQRRTRRFKLEEGPEETPRERRLRKGRPIARDLSEASE